MRKNFLSVLSILCLIFVFAACSPNKGENQEGDSASSKKDSMTVQHADTLGALPELSIYNLPSEWTNQDNETIHLKDLRGDVVVAVMIYTSCQASCPRLVADMKRIHDSIGAQFNDDVKYVLVSIDPETDTPEKLHKFAESRKMTSDEWVFLRGTKDDTRTFAATLSVSYKKVSPMDFAHSNIISVFDRNGVLKYQKKGFEGGDEELIQTVKDLVKS